MTVAPTPSRAKLAKRGVPALDISGPRTLGLAATTALACLLAAAALVNVPTGPTTTTRGRIQAEPIALKHADGGVVARVHVKDGADVESGALIATFDTRLIDSQISGLKRQMDGIQMHVSGLKQEAEALAASERQSAARQRLGGLEAQIASSEQEGFGLEVRLAMAMQERSRTEIRAPLRGRVMKLAVTDMASVPANALIAEIQPASDRLVLEANWPVTEVRSATAGQPVSVWLSGAAPWSRALSGRIEQVLTDSAKTDVTRVRVRVSADLAGGDLTSTQGQVGHGPEGERDFTLQLISGAPSLLSLLVAPLFGAAPTPHSTVVKVPQ
jgi:multidrug efflux pump subunit AcrA (membrane-fusion protein)